MRPPGRTALPRGQSPWRRTWRDCSSGSPCFAPPDPKGRFFRGLGEAASIEPGPLPSQTERGQAEHPWRHFARAPSAVLHVEFFRRPVVLSFVRLSIATRIFLGFAAVLCVFGAVSSFAVWRMHAIGE